MSYQSIEFLMFVVAVLFFYYIFGKKGQRLVLGFANLCFYVASGLEFLPFLLTTLLSTYFTGRIIGNIYRSSDEAIAGCNSSIEKKTVRNTAKKKAKRVLLCGMFVTIMLLAVCKYSSFAIRNFNDVLELVGLPQLPLFKTVLPLGISFYSFMALSYVLDVFWKRYPAEERFLNYAVYLTYFPHVMQGPINRFNEFKVQIEKGVSFCTQNLVFGSELMLWGLFKKLVIADRIAPFVNHVFTKWYNCSGLVLVLGMVAYSIQIYADFSGCIDIVTGVSEMLGIKLRKNFNHPYFSKTMAEFWRRWHISLQEWFKDYVYYPVSTSALLRRVKKYFNNKNESHVAEMFSSCIPIFVVWMITGIWHGASWNYVVWGLYHAFLLISSQILHPWIERVTIASRINTHSFFWKQWQMIRTFLLCGIGRVFSRTSILQDAVGFLKRMVTDFSKDLSFETFADNLEVVVQAFVKGTNNVYYLFVDFINKDFGLGISLANIVMVLFATCVLWCVDYLQEKGSLRQMLSEKNICIRWLIVFLGVFSVIIFGIYGPGFNASSFIYEQF